MTTIALLIAAWGLLQGKPPARLHPMDPTEDAWPVEGTIDRPDESIVEIMALRIERQWDAKLGKFREGPSAESRTWARALVSQKTFRAELPKSPPGFYRVQVCQGTSELHSDRLFLGRPSDLTSSWAGSARDLEGLRTRLLALLDQAEKISKGELKPAAKGKEEFLKALSKEDHLLDETIVRSDFTATTLLLREVVWSLRNAQIWASPSTKDDEGKFLKPETTFGTLRATLDAARDVILSELRASVATLLRDVLQRAQGSPAKLLRGVREAARQAKKALERVEDPDKDFRDVVALAADAEESSLKDATAAVDRALASLVEKP